VNAVSGREEREEESKELGRYRADLIAALLPGRTATACGAVAGFLVFLVPIVVVGGSMLLISVTFNFGVLPLVWLGRLLGLPVPPGAPGSGTPGEAVATPVPTARPTEIPPLPVEGQLPVAGSEWLPVLLVLFWPVALLAVGAALAWLYRWRRRARLDQLERAPLDLSILPEAALFYVLTAVGGALVGVGTFVAFGVNLVFAWAGALMWRWLFDRFAWRVAPQRVREEALRQVARERETRKRAREAG